MVKYIRYTAGYRYQLEDAYQHQTGIVPVPDQPGNRFVGLAPDGLLTIAAGYAWDGASGPAINTPSFLRGSLVHDALYQLIGLGVLTVDDRLAADRLLREICIEDGMWRIRAAWVYAAVRAFGRPYAVEGDTILTAP